MNPSKETAAVNRDRHRLSSEKRLKVESGSNRAGGSRPSVNARRRGPFSGARAVVLSGGVALAAILAVALASGAGGLYSLLGPPSPAVAGQSVAAHAPDPAAIGTIPRVGEQAPDGAFQTGGRSVSISSLHGKKIMLWLLSTWCSSCAQGVLGLAKNQPDLARAGIKIVALRNYRNLGYPGPSIAKFIGEFDAHLLGAPNWTLGDASEQLARRYNPRGYPDIYFLIDGSGMVRAVDSAPSFTIAKILRFAGKGA